MTSPRPKAYNSNPSGYYWLMITHGAPIQTPWLECLLQSSKLWLGMRILWFIDKNTNPEREIFVGPTWCAIQLESTPKGYRCRSADRAIRNPSLTFETETPCGEATSRASGYVRRTWLLTFWIGYQCRLRRYGIWAGL
jgi:hypothetical protein